VGRVFERLVGRFLAKEYVPTRKEFRRDELFLTNRKGGRKRFTFD
jgi:hypothetical protein